jgi:hypothetical protein
MSVSAITNSYGISGTDNSYKLPTQNSYQTPKTTQNSWEDQVALTSQAKAKAMELDGYPVSLIAAKLGVDAKTVNEYIGSTCSCSS